MKAIETDYYFVICPSPLYTFMPESFNPDYAARKFAGDAGRKARRRTYVLQVLDNASDAVKFEVARILAYNKKTQIAHQWLTG